MGLFKRKERSHAPKASLFTTYSGKKETRSKTLSVASSSDGNLSRTETPGPATDPVAHVLSSTPTLSTNQDEPRVGQTLWDRAYDSLKAEDQKMVEEYEKLLSVELQDLSMSSFHRSFTATNNPRLNVKRRILCVCGYDAGSRQEPNR
jgi:N-terminal domain of NWD NACHT-NTPase